jgi:hypothetical protein
MTYGAIWVQGVSSWKFVASAVNEQFLCRSQLRDRLFVLLIILVAHASFQPVWIGLLCLSLGTIWAAASGHSRAIIDGEAW